MAVDFAIVGSFLAASLPAANAQEEPTGLEDALPTEQLAQVKLSASVIV
ncbi:hypothetical protein HED51_03910 [Ochrobactrum grignonense]|nr:hypothetical protein [Brucella grignonensis]